MPGKTLNKIKYRNQTGKGRPSVINRDVVRKIEEAAMLGCKHTEIALYAGISRSALNSFYADNPEFKARIEDLRESPMIQARKNNMDLLKSGDAVHTRWFLERRGKDEFSLQHSLDITGAVTGTIEEKQAALHDYLMQFKAAKSDSKTD